MLFYPNCPPVKPPLTFPICTTTCHWDKPGAKVASGTACTNLGLHSPGQWLPPRHQSRLPATRSLSYRSPLALGKIWPKPKLIWQLSPRLCIAQQGRVLVLTSSRQCLLKCPFPATLPSPKSPGKPASSLLGSGCQTRERKKKPLQGEGWRKSLQPMLAPNSPIAASQLSI